MAEFNDKDWLRIASTAFSASTSFFENQVQGQIEDNIRMFQNKHPRGSKYNTAFYKNRSKIARPKTRSAGQKFEAALKKAYFSTTDLVQIRGRLESNKDQALSATLNTNLLNYRLTETIPWFKVLIGAGQEAWKSGAVFSYQYWEYKQFPNGKVIDRPRIDLIPPEHIRFDPNADWLDPINTSPYVIRMVPMYLKDVRDRMDIEDDAKGGQPKWNKLEDSELLGAIAANNATSLDQAREEKQAEKPNSTQIMDDYATVWVHENFVEMDGQDYVYYTLGTIAILSEPKPIEEVYIHGMRPIVMGHVLIEPFKVFPAGMPELGQPIQEEINDIANTRLDNVKLVLNKRYFAKRGRNIDMISLLRNTPGSITVMDNPTEDVHVISTPDITNSSYAEQDRLNVDYDELIGTFSQGSVASNRKLGETVGGLNLIASGAGVVNDLLVATFNESWVEPVLKQLLKLEQKYETDLTLLALISEPEVRKFYIRYGDDVGIDYLLDQDLLLTVNVGIESTNPQMRVERLMFALDVLGRVVSSPTASSIDMEEIKKEVFGALGYKDAKRFFKEGQEDPRIAQLQEELMQLQQVINTKQIENQTKLQIEQGRMQLQGAKLELEKMLAELQVAKDQASLQNTSLDIAKKQIDIQRAMTGVDDLYKTEELNIKRQQLINDRDIRLVENQTKRDAILADWKKSREELDAKLKITLVNAGAGQRGVDNNTIDQGAIEKREQGGPVQAGQPYIVGEKQPEVFVPEQDGEILPVVPDEMAVSHEVGIGNTVNENVVPNELSESHGDTMMDISTRENRSKIAEELSSGFQVIIGKGQGKTNNNPGNLRFANQSGATEVKDTRKKGKSFAKFESPEAGFKALNQDLLAKAARDLTVDEALSMYAPSNENETAKYKRFIYKQTGLSGTEKLKDVDILSVSKAIAQKESNTIVQKGE